MKPINMIRRADPCQPWGKLSANQEIQDPPGPGKGRTYTSFRPDSLETYASHRPSGENIE